MHRSCIPSDEKPRPSRQSDQLRDRTLDRRGRTLTRSIGLTSQFFLARTTVKNRADALRCQRFRDSAIALRGPSLRSPARTGIQNREIANSGFRQASGQSVARPRHREEVRARGIVIFRRATPLARETFCSITCAPRAIAWPRVPQTGGRFARFRRAIHHARARPARQHRGPNRSLQVDRNVIARRANVIPHSRDLLQRRHRKQRLLHPVRLTA